MYAEETRRTTLIRCLCVYVRVFVPVYVCVACIHVYNIRLCICICIYVCAHERLKHQPWTSYTCIQAHMDAIRGGDNVYDWYQVQSGHAFTYIFMCVCICLHILIYVHIDEDIYIYIYIYIYICTYLHIYAHVDACCCKSVVLLCAGPYRYPVLIQPRLCIRPYPHKYIIYIYIYIYKFKYVFPHLDAFAWGEKICGSYLVCIMIMYTRRHTLVQTCVPFWTTFGNLY